MQPFDFISSNFWLICIVFAWVNFFANSRAGGKLELNAEDQIVRRRYLFNFALVTSLPWLVMGAGCLSGSAPAVWYYFRPQDGNPYVIGWLAGMVLMQLWLSWWVLFAGGARKLVQYRLGRTRVGGQSKQMSEFSIKLMAVAAPIFAVLWIFIMSQMDVKISRLPTHATVPTAQQNGTDGRPVQ